MNKVKSKSRNILAKSVDLVEVKPTRYFTIFDKNKYTLNYISVIDIFLISSVCPETFSYTTQENIMMEMPLMVFNLGAPAERVAHYDNGYIIDDVSVNVIIKNN